MAKGIVKWFDDKKGYGFITDEANEHDFFVHFTGINTDGFKTLKNGQQVTFDLVEGAKGFQATNVLVVGV